MVCTSPSASVCATSTVIYCRVSSRNLLKESTHTRLVGSLYCIYIYLRNENTVHGSLQNL